MSEDVRKYIRQCDRCMQFKKKKEQTELYPIMATYPLELVHLDFLSIGGKDDKMKSVLDTPTPRCHGNRSLLIVLFLLKLRVVPHGTKGTGPKFVTGPVCASS